MTQKLLKQNKIYMTKQLGNIKEKWVTFKKKSMAITIIERNQKI